VLRPRQGRGRRLAPLVKIPAVADRVLWETARTSSGSQRGSSRSGSHPRSEASCILGREPLLQRREGLIETPKLGVEPGQVQAGSLPLRAKVLQLAKQRLGLRPLPCPLQALGEQRFRPGVWLPHVQLSRSRDRLLVAAEAGQSGRMIPGR
jgi:hypothetical protein